MQRRLTRFLSMLMLGVLASLMFAGSLSPATAADNDLLGSVVDTNGAAVAEVEVTVKQVDGNFTRKATTDTQGLFTVKTPGPGDYTMTVDPDQVPEGVIVPDAATKGVPVTLPSAKTPTINLQRQESFYGVVENQDGDTETPVEGVVIMVESADGAFTEESTTDEEGNWQVFVPGPGSYTVAVDTEELPEGISTREGKNYELSADVASGQGRAMSFPMGESNANVLTTSDQAVQLLVEGIRFGLLLALASLGLSLIFGTTGLVNFAHGEMIALGAIVTWALNHAGLHFIIAAAIAVPLCAAVGGLQELILWRPLRRRKTGLVAMMIVTIGLSIFARFLFQFFIGAGNNSYEQYAVQQGLNFGPVSLAPRDLWSMGIALIVLIAAGLFVIHSKMGKAMRAVSDNPALAAASGIDVNRVILFVWVMGGAMAGLAGLLLGLSQQVKFEMGFTLLLLVFAGVILGGLGTAFGALVGSLVVGLFVTFSTLWIPPELKNVAALAILIVILLVRPQGILGRSERVG